MQLVVDYGLRGRDGDKNGDCASRPERAPKRQINQAMLSSEKGDEHASRSMFCKSFIHFSTWSIGRLEK